MVLLKNDRETLPLSKTSSDRCVIGPLADDHRAPLGWWSGDGKAEDTVTPLAGIKGEGVSADESDLCERLRHHMAIRLPGLQKQSRWRAAVDVAIVFVGESAEMVGEAASKSSLDLTGSPDGSGKSDPGHRQTHDCRTD